MRLGVRSFRATIVGFILFGLLSFNYSAFAQEQLDESSGIQVDEQIQDLVKEEIEVPSNVYKGEIEITNVVDSNLTGETETVKKGTKLELTVSTVLSSDTSIEGDEFFAEITSDLSVDNSIVVPMGSIIHGAVTESKGERRLGRDGYVKIEFDNIITPDGREIPIEAKLSTKSHPLKSFAKVALTDAGYTLLGGALGGIFALKVGGIGLAVASNGYSLAGGAAVGGAIGATASLVRKGKPKIINPGDQIKIKLTSDIDLPVIKPESLDDDEKFLEGLSVDILAYEYVRDPFGNPNTINLTLDIVNKTNRSFSFFDMALVSEHGGVYYPSPFGDTQMWFQKLSPSSKINGTLAFSVTNTRDAHWLVFYDKYTRKPLAKISMRNAIRKLQLANKKK